MNFFRTYKKLWLRSLTLLMSGGVLVVSVLAFSGSAFGWFSRNTNSTSTGEAVRIDMPESVFISSSFEPVDGQTTVPYSTLTENGFGSGIKVTPTNILYPVTTPDGESFYYSTNVDPEGHALESSDEETPTFASVEEGDEEFFFVEQELYVCAAGTKDANVRLTNVTFAPGDAFETSNLYKAVRVAVSVDGGTSYKIVRCADGGSASPADDEDNGPEGMGEDPSYSSDALGDAKIVFTAPKMQTVGGENACVFVKLIVRIWIEGQNTNAVAAYAGTAFNVRLGFDLVNE